MAYQSINPNTGIEFKSFEHLSTAQLDKALVSAEQGFDTWRKLSYGRRGIILHKAAALLRAHVDDFAKLATLEMGKRIHEARAEVKFSADILAYYADHAEAFLAPTELHPKVGQAHLENHPLGPLFCVEPWNSPYYQLARVAGPQLMAGNVLLVKHAGCVPQCALAFEKLFISAGAPVGLYTNLFISHEQCNRVIDDPRIHGVALTGSVPAGRLIAARARQNLKKSTLELGGSDAFIVLDDADLDHTLPWAVWGRMYNAGQTCCAAKRFIVQEAVADEFLARFKSALQVDSAVAHGAELLMGGKRIDRPGCFMQPTVLGHIQPNNPAYRDEFFGPVVSFYRVKTEEEAIALANDSDFGLGGSVWTPNAQRGLRVAAGIHSGMVFINNIDWADAELPFGGVQHSGYGRELGNLGIQEFVNKKLVRTGQLDAPA